MEENLKTPSLKTPGRKIAKKPAGQKPALITYVDKVKESIYLRYIKHIRGRRSLAGSGDAGSAGGIWESWRDALNLSICIYIHIFISIASIEIWKHAPI